MPRPLSKTFNAPGVDDFDALPKEAIGSTSFGISPLFQSEDTSRLTPKNFLKKAASSLSSFGQSTEYNLTPSGDEGKNKVTVGPTGFNITENVETSKPVWALELNPWMQSGSFRAGDFQVGGTASFAPSAFISKGPFRFDVGYGAPPVPIPEGTEPRMSGPENWAKLSVDFKPERTVGTPAEVSVGQAVSPFVGTREEPKTKTAREEADELISRFRQTNADWYRP